jgi:hypothetical protein
MSTAELLLAAQLEQAGIPFEREFRFYDGRRYRADFVIFDDVDGPTLLIEVEGGTWVEGRHSRGKGFEADCEKQALAVIAGYRYLRVTSAQVEDGRALDWIRQALGMEERIA